MPTDAPFTISDLARLTGLSVRTIRYYLAQGLIPASGESGPGAHYGQGHLDRLRLVRRLQQQHLPLAEIRNRLASLTDDVVASLAGEDVPDVRPEAEATALDYIRSVLEGAQWAALGAPASPAPPSTPPSPSALASQPVPPPSRAPSGAMPRLRDVPAAAPNTLLRRSIVVPSDLHESLPDAAGQTAGPSADPASPSVERSQWERLSLGPNLELHVRRPLGRLEQKRVERLITIARQVLKEEQP